MKCWFSLTILLVAAATGYAATVQVTGFGVQGWYSDDTRDAAGSDLVGVTNTHYGKPGQAPSAADDTAIALQIQFVAGPVGSTYGGAVSIDGTTGNSGKSTISVIDTTTGFAPASDLIDPGFYAQYEWYPLPNPTSRKLAFRIGIQSTDWANSQTGFTATRSGESAWDLILVHVDTSAVDNQWNTIYVDKDTSGVWALYAQAGNAYFTAPGGGTLQSLQDWANDPTWGPLLFGAGAKVTSVQLGLGSGQRQHIAYVDYLKTSILNGGDTIDFTVPPTITPGWHAFVIRENATEGPPLILANNNYSVDAVEFVTFASGQKAALATDAISGAKVSMISTLHVDRLDDVLNSDSLYGPYFNIWVTDGAGNYAVASNEPSDAEWADSRWDVPDWDFLKTKRCKIYETTGALNGQPGTSWVATVTGKASNLVFEDIADLTMEAPPAAYIQNPANGVGSGAPDVLGTDEAFAFNWVFGDTLSNYISGTSEGFVVANYEATVTYPVYNVTRSIGYVAIQPAIDAANPGDQITVAAGMYNEKVTIPTAVEIVGEDGAVLDGTGLGLVTGLKIHASDVTWNNIDVMHFGGNGIIVGYEPGGPGNLQNVKITNCEIAHIQPGSSHGFGIYVGYESEALGTGALTDQLDYSGLEVSGNEIHDTAAASLVLQSIKSSGEAMQVTDNAMYDSAQSGIWIDSAENLLIQGNEVHNCSNGVFVSAYADGYYEGNPNQPFDSRDIDLTCNTLSNNSGSGIVVYDGWPATISVNDNVITGNGSHGVYNWVGGGTIDATHNWWGTIDEPSIAAMVTGPVDYDPWLAGAPACGDNLLVLDVKDASLYVKPSETVVIDMDALNLLQPVTGVQAVMNFSSEYFATGSGAVNVAPGEGPWTELIYSVWNTGGDLDVAVGVDLVSPGGTQADNTTAVITLTSNGTEGVTKVVFRPDGSDIASTFFSDVNHQPVYPNKIDSQWIVIDGTPPTVEVTSPNGGENLMGGGSWTITWTAGDTYLDADSVQIAYFDGSDWQIIATGEDNDGTYDWNPVPSLDINNALVRVTVSDLAGNSADDSSDADFIIDSTDPVVDDIAATQGGPDLTPSGSGNATQGVVNIAVEVSDNLAGVAGAPSVTVTPDGGPAEAATLVDESPAGTFNYTWTVTSSTPNGTATITVSGLTDNAGNVAADATDTFDVNKTQITGTVSQSTLSTADYGYTRDVVFKATDGGGAVLATWTVPVSFTNNTGTKIASGPYMLTDVPSGTVNLSAKTAWTLRERQGVTLDGDDQAVNDFTLIGGDLNGTNSVNILDYSILKASWPSPQDPAGDINGDVNVNALDYTLLKESWFTAGDPE